MNKQVLLEKLKSQGYDQEIIEAFKKVNREEFVLPEFRDKAYEDSALPIGFGQTISQPSTIAFMLALLDPQPAQKIIEVGSGSGYVQALLAEMVPKAKIFGTERVSQLVERSKEALANYDNVKIEYTPNELGLENKAPFDRILVSAAASSFPEELAKQLSKNGIMVCPIGNSIVKALRINGVIEMEEYPGFAFVRLYHNKE